jgi:hypothetical protein
MIFHGFSLEKEKNQGDSEQVSHHWTKWHRETGCRHGCIVQLQTPGRAEGMEITFHKNLGF